MVPFNKPCVAPESEDDQKAFDEVDDLIGEHEMSTCVGWAIQLKKVLMCKEAVREMRASLLRVFLGRSTQNWALLLICAKQVKV